MKKILNYIWLFFSIFFLGILISKLLGQTPMEIKPMSWDEVFEKEAITTIFSGAIVGVLIYIYVEYYKSKYKK